MTARLRKAAAGSFRDMLTAAVLNGLARHPDQIDRHAEALMRLAAALPEAATAVDALLHMAQDLERTAQPTILPAGILPPPPAKTRFTFLDEGSDPDDAQQDLAEAVALLVERPELDAAIVAATARFESDPEGAFAEQQRLRKRKLEIESRLGQMARKRDAALEKDGAASDGNSAGDVTGISGGSETE
ncbi:MAG: DNA primase, partial [Alteraurantiacibacter sp.]